MVDLEDLYGMFERARRSRGLSQADVSNLATGISSNSLLQNIRRGKSPNYETVARVAEVLGLEFYLGPKRPTLEGTQLALADSPRAVRSVQEDYAILGCSLTTFDSSISTIPHPDDEFSRGTDGPGQIAIRQDWLAEQGLDTAHASLHRFTGDAMAPVIPSGALLVIDWRRREVPKGTAGRVFAFQLGPALRVRRLRWSGPRQMLLIPANPASPHDVLMGDELHHLTILGQVMLTISSP